MSVCKKQVMTKDKHELNLNGVRNKPETTSKSTKNMHSVHLKFDVNIIKLIPLAEPFFSLSSSLTMSAYRSNVHCVLSNNCYVNVKIINYISVIFFL